MNFHTNGIAAIAGKQRRSVAVNVFKSFFVEDEKESASETDSQSVAESQGEEGRVDPASRRGRRMTEKAAAQGMPRLGGTRRGTGRRVGRRRARSPWRRSSRARRGAWTPRAGGGGA